MTNNVPKIFSPFSHFTLLQGKAQYLQADVSKVVDDTNPKKMKNVQLKYPLRIRVTKSPVLIHFDMFKVAVSFNFNIFHLLSSLLLPFFFVCNADFQ